jgi:enamine deaminase RidA (YjgF/YER057c/UK114 family)
MHDSTNDPLKNTTTQNTNQPAHDIILPEGWSPTKGYSAGILAQAGRHLFIAGQIGWNAEQVFESDDFLDQFAQALENVVAVLKQSGGQITDLTEMTIYVTDLDAYRNAGKALGTIWKAKVGRHYPAMALVGVAGLVELRAKVEIRARAVIL